jgi:hypothetical protein
MVGTFLTLSPWILLRGHSQTYKKHEKRQATIAGKEEEMKAATRLFDDGWYFRLVGETIWRGPWQDEFEAGSMLEYYVDLLNQCEDGEDNVDEW